jgi:mannose-6-phosphate isomerase-like protein (cupin superfamily)
MAITRIGELVPMDDDPDDHRPNSTWALVIDGGGEHGRVDSLVLLFERMGPGDAIPLHTHTVDEVVVVDEGTGEARLGDHREEVSPGSVVFVPAGTPHCTRNIGEGPLRIHAAFPTDRIDIRYLERNPAPGTEDREPSAFRYDPRTGEVTELDP